MRLLSLTLFAVLSVRCAAAEEESPLYPLVEPLETGYLRVSELHSIYYEVCGNEDGLPVIVLHGGPGASAGPWMRRYFDPARFRVILFDQRGAGRSRPRAEWRENTTQDLIADIDRLRKTLDIEEKAILFGGSWGTTLALAYAEEHPENVRGLVLRGVFLATRQETDHFYHGGAGKFFPEAYAGLREIVPEPERLDYPRQLFEMTQSEDRTVRDRAELGWVYYEARLSSAKQTDAEIRWSLAKNRDLVRTIAVIENHYLMNNCFLEEGQLLRDADRIRHIPTFIVNGRFDVICPPAAAFDLAKRLHTVELELPDDAGHSAGEPAIEKALVRGVKWVADRVR